MTSQTTYDKEIKCRCGETFVFTEGEQKFYAKKGFTEPKKCPDCRAKKKAKEGGKIQGECESCGANTILVAEVGLCGPCCFGEAETINGNW